MGRKRHRLRKRRRPCPQAAPRAPRQVAPAPLRAAVSAWQWDDAVLPAPSESAPGLDWTTGQVSPPVAPPETAPDGDALRLDGGPSPTAHDNEDPTALGWDATPLDWASDPAALSDEDPTALGLDATALDWAPDPTALSDEGGWARPDELPRADPCEAAQSWSDPPLDWDDGRPALDAAAPLWDEAPEAEEGARQRPRAQVAADRSADRHRAGIIIRLAANAGWTSEAEIALLTRILADSGNPKLSANRLRALLPTVSLQQLGLAHAIRGAWEEAGRLETSWAMSWNAAVEIGRAIRGVPDATELALAFGALREVGPTLGMTTTRDFFGFVRRMLSEAPPGHDALDYVRFYACPLLRRREHARLARQSVTRWTGQGLPHVGGGARWAY